VGFSGNGNSELAKLRDQLAQLRRPDELARAKAPEIEARLRDILRGKSFPPRADGSPSTAASLADYVNVTAEGKAFKLVISRPAAEYLQDGTSRMQARPLFDEDETRGVIESAFAEAVAAVMGGR
jgi:hypothetical protein